MTPLEEPPWNERRKIRKIYRLFLRRYDIYSYYLNGANIRLFGCGLDHGRCSIFRSTLCYWIIRRMKNLHIAMGRKGFHWDD
ncbi:uncharacterized protein H6S33_010884 [Morchella sextelata]|uniref:uncharacterized protein n=1 Tax=Morchella sextelata TaxID=1174677 RepID=UPI001D03E697|nr:uncharacterized protein H6S33_010884 [Morchella sextelata]KAH0611619.1 hypothetical protein H6S33_010884 [Morchella sextelata]